MTKECRSPNDEGKLLWTLEVERWVAWAAYSMPVLFPLRNRNRGRGAEINHRGTETRRRAWSFLPTADCLLLEKPEGRNPKSESMTKSEWRTGRSNDQW